MALRIPGAISLRCPGATAPAKGERDKAFEAREAEVYARRFEFADAVVAVLDLLEVGVPAHLVSRESGLGIQETWAGLLAAVEQGRVRRLPSHRIYPSRMWQILKEEDHK
jgi:hypothetical protein